MKKFPLGLYLLINFFSSIFVFAQTEGTDNLFSPKNRLKFGNHLFDNSDYLRAAGEYQSYLNVVNNDTIRFQLAKCFQNMQRTSEALDNFKTLFFNTNLEDEARAEYLRTIFRSGELLYFRELCNSAVYRPRKYNRDLNKLLNYSYLLTESAMPALEEFLSPFENSDSSAMIDFYTRKTSPQNKDPMLAGILSAVIPGAGKIYTENYGDGITSLLLTGILSYIAVNNFDAGHNTRAWIFTGLAAYFYAGNIYGSVASAQIYNAGLKFNFENDLQFFIGEKNYYLPEFNFNP